MTSTTKRILTFYCAFLALSFLLLRADVHASSVGIFHENFNSFTGFPWSGNDVGGHKTNFGVPTIAEGADNDWIGGRFEHYDSNPLTSDIGVLKSGIGGNGTTSHPFDNPMGRVGDDAGIVAKIDLTQYEDVTLEFDWLTWSVTTNDRFVVAYYVGDGLGDPTPAGAVYDWFSNPTFGNGDMSSTDPNGAANTWYQNNWTEVLRDTSPGVFQHESGISLPGGDVLYLAFWLDNGDGDIAKVDNIWIMGTQVPEPGSMAIMVLGMAGGLLTVRRRK